MIKSRLLVGTAVLAVVVAACSSSGGTAAPASEAPAASEAPVASAPAASEPAASAPAGGNYKIGFSNPLGVGNGFREEQLCTAKAEALVKQHEADRQRQEFAMKHSNLEREAEAAAFLQEKRKNLLPQDRVHVARFDAVGTVVRIDARKQTALVSVGFGQWEVPLAEVTPQD